MSSEKGDMADESCQCAHARASREGRDAVVRCPSCGAEWHSSAAASVMLADGWKCLRCGQPLDDSPRPPASPSGI